MIEDLEAETTEHPWFDEFWASKAARLEEIRVPAFVVASWSDQGLHSRGTLEGFRRISSEHKWLDVHGRKKWGYYYDPENVERQRAFFDQFLRGVDRGVLDWPTVRMEVRERYYQGTRRVAGTGRPGTPSTGPGTWTRQRERCSLTRPSRPRWPSTTRWAAHRARWMPGSP